MLKQVNFSRFQFSYLLNAYDLCTSPQGRLLWFCSFFLKNYLFVQGWCACTFQSMHEQIKGQLFRSHFCLSSLSFEARSLVISVAVLYSQAARWFPLSLPPIWPRSAEAKIAHTPSSISAWTLGIKFMSKALHRKHFYSWPVSLTLI